MSYDLAIIGAGITGAGVAQAAAAAGYKVVLLESSSVGGATSSASSKLIHGGLRYLESGQLGLVRESLLERELLLKLAPDLVTLAPLHIPVYRNSSRSPITIRAGLSLYHLLSGFSEHTRFSSLARHQWSELDGITTQGLRSVFRYFEAQTNDQALTHAVVQSAQKLGAELLLPATFQDAEIHKNGCEIRYTDNNDQHTLQARVLVNCAGPWAWKLNQRISPIPKLPNVDLIGGSHLLLPPLLERHYYLESPTDGRAIFALPWQGKLLVGTTEIEHQGSPETVQCHPHEMHYLLNVLKHYFPHLHPLPSSADSFAGLRVLPRSTSGAFGCSREVMMVADNPGKPKTLTLMGGKLTTYRATAEQALKRLYPSLPAARPIANTRSLHLTPAE
ncbi:FAD-dependent oxidoreductase [Gilvimarinus sp. SDUM040013]|uniref:FAD-dependent oxidoreductase n=1 Tax=Gilvimarinus gilvus TaxID=3058038 RepID=A0ABU4RSI5_9GAMM|nr:FAD-dependent oxidoreductase [Gilvimarinus sp. SDUM040013]MDO3388296.1 FAD-dependent oxidoreductase [Gilvimarinus sp. SDUM040013]MDX6847846.1 FAD-dependent oxidoreductase [Gilvimarinus sp. SDUM040013]